MGFEVLAETCTIPDVFPKSPKAAFWKAVKKLLTNAKKSSSPFPGLPYPKQKPQITPPLTGVPKNPQNPKLKSHYLASLKTPKPSFGRMLGVPERSLSWPCHNMIYLAFSPKKENFSFKKLGFGGFACLTPRPMTPPGFRWRFYTPRCLNPGEVIGQVCRPWYPPLYISSKEVEPWTRVRCSKSVSFLDLV